VTTKTRLQASALAGLLTAGAVTWFAATHRHAVLAADAARSAAHGQSESVTSILVIGFVATAVAVTVFVFIAASVVAARRRRRLLQQYYRGDTATGRIYSGHGSHWGGW
jgi:heme/copper-type cytochrome/quinol oxidase subunit 2